MALAKLIPAILVLMAQSAGTQFQEETFAAGTRNYNYRDRVHCDKVHRDRVRHASYLKMAGRSAQNFCELLDTCTQHEK